MPPASSEILPFGEHRARIVAYLRGVRLPLQSVAWTIIEEHRHTSVADRMLRSDLVLWACAACGGSPHERSDALPVAAAFDLFDRFMRLHNELVEGRDAGETVRGHGSVVARWGLGQTLNAGDALYAMALRALAQDVGNPERRLAAAALVTRAVLQAIEGRSADVSEAGDATGLFARVRSLRRRSGALTGAAMESGALLAGASERVCRAFNRAGRLLAAAAKSRDAALSRRLAHKAVTTIDRSIPDRAHLDAFDSFARHVADQAA